MNDRQLATPVDRAALAEHYRQVESFQQSRVKSAKRISRLLMVVAALSLIGNLAQTWTIAAMMPLTRIVPVYLWVRGDGTVDSSVAMSRLPATQSEAVINAALWEYVRLREGYSFDTAQYGYDVVSEMSAPAVRSQYQSFFNYPDPASPLVKLGKRGTIAIEHISSANLASNIQQIRFRRIVTVEGQTPVVTSWTATIQFSTVSSMPVALRLRNPGGIVVMSYQAAEDSVQ
jgi:type IV secretion system protein VirB8